MRQAKYLLLLAVAAIAVTVPIAQGTSAAKDPRVTKLIKSVKALRTQVGALQSDVGSLQSDVRMLNSEVATLRQADGTLQSGLNSLQSELNSLQSCVKYRALPTTDYGPGYLWLPPGAGSGSTPFKVSALDVTHQGDSPQFWLAELNPACVSALSAQR